MSTLSLREVIEHHLFGEVAKVTCSFGVAEYVPGDSAEDLTARADVALYRAKLNGRNCVELAPCRQRALRWDGSHKPHCPATTSLGYRSHLFHKEMRFEPTMSRHCPPTNPWTR